MAKPTDKPKVNFKPGDSYSDEERKEIAAIAKAQLKLDRDRQTAAQEFKDRHKKLTARLKAANVSRQAFAQPYQNYRRVQEADDIKEELTAKQDNRVYLAEEKLCYEALGLVEPSGWNKVFEEADKINIARAKEAAKAAKSDDVKDSGTKAQAAASKATPAPAPVDKPADEPAVAEGTSRPAQLN